ncbi:SMP-30/gluconolactonase/LRE family protein [Erythrobacter sp. F6033]|uniref:SMP-30/gluconolactonase/LRE family protein n=1 Tax=Erythrobacter sp. F6033 TaxID=2926401 RepID=UPI001FF1DA3C|nr:SMP-30/gluconolactonase/LRE family protein [Erythrobacter sp. F6033]MCK0129288.1 SMP-30/gluconolactonase/LRE family protein [Erythrobacter sp. F6033]
MMTEQGECRVVDVFDDRACGLGEGPLWHPDRQELFWVDIPNQKVMSSGVEGQREHRFDEMVSALALIDADTLLLATETGLHSLAIADWTTERLCDIEAGDPETRSNDGRADPWGGFWIGTMSKSAEEGAGAVYRYYRGELHVLVPSITIPNGICFDHGAKLAYFTDSAAKKTWRIALDDDGWPAAEPELFLDFTEDGTTIDGAIIDQQGHILAAIFDGGAVFRISPDGKIVDRFETQTPRSTCPAFGGKNYTDMFVTTAAIGLANVESDCIVHGTTLRFAGCVIGVAEPVFRTN